MSVCSHDPECPGYGVAHEANMSEGERIAVGVPLGKDLSQKKVKRLLRSARKREREQAEEQRWVQDLFLSIPEEEPDAVE